MQLQAPSLRATALIAAGAAVAAVLTGVLPGTASAQAQVSKARLAPLMGWTSWGYLRRHPSKAKVEAQARALRRSGLLAAGYDYVGVDDFYYQCSRRGHGPAVDAYGRWRVDPALFPPAGRKRRVNGMKVVGRYVHGLGEKFGIYVTPGISRQAVARNTRIYGTRYTARDIADGRRELNYDCGGMEGINYLKPGAQAFIDSWANQFASWGVDYVKLDGVGPGDILDIRAWSLALRRTGRPIQLGLSANLAIAGHRTWVRYADSWRTGRDIQCYCGDPFPLTRWSRIQTRFSQVARWQAYGGHGGFNDLDAIEIGNGRNDGISLRERQSQLSLWALAASPLFLGSNLTHLDSTDVRYLTNRAVIAVDQDAVDARRIVNRGNSQVFAKTEHDGAVIIGLFNYSGKVATTDTVSLPRAGISGSAIAVNLWTGVPVGTVSGTYSVRLGPGAVELLKVTPTVTAG